MLNNAKIDKATKVILSIFLVLVLLSLATIYYEYIVTKNFEIVELEEEGGENDEVLGVEPEQ